MRGVSSRYLYTLSGSGSTTARVRPVDPRVRDANGWPAPAAGVGPLPVISGDLVLDGSADLRMRTEGLRLAPYWPDTGQDAHSAAGQFDMTVAGATAAASARPGQPVWPGDPWAPLTPYGRLLLIEFGVDLGGGNWEYARAGYVRVESLDQPDEPDGPISVDTADLFSFPQDAKMVADRRYAVGTSVQTIFEQLLFTFRWPGMPAGFTTADLNLDAGFAAQTLGAPRRTEGDRLGFLMKLAKDRGRRMWWDGRGKLISRAASNPVVPVLDIGGPNDRATPLTQSGRRITREGVRNVVVAEQTGLSGQAGARYVAEWAPGSDTSPTDLATFGVAVERWSSPLIDGATTAKSAAITRRDNLRRLPEARSVRHAVNGAIEPGDIVRVWPKGSTDPGGWTLREVETTRIPLVPGEEQVTTFRDVRID